MRTAVIVSGVLRYIVEASSSWHFKNADYFLLVDNDITEPQSRDTVGKATAILHDVLESTKVKFTGIYIDTDTGKKFTEDNLIKYHQIEMHGMLNMAWKWKLASQIVSSYSTQQPYDNVVILRPDLWLYKKHNNVFDYPQTLDNVITATSVIVADWDTTRNYPTMGDVLLSMNISTLNILSRFYDYFLARYEDTLYCRYDVHSLLAAFMLDNNIAVTDQLFDHLGFVVLRDNAMHMFDNNRVILPEFNEYHLLQKQTEWWKQKYG